MGFLSNLFSKQTCSFCNKEVGMTKRKKLRDKNYICSDCEKNCSAYIEVSDFDKDFIREHMEYMKKQDALYKKEVEQLDKKEKERFVNAWNGIVFIDSIGMMEIVSPKYDKKNVKELFRYDQIQDFNYYTVDNTSGEGKKYSESGIEIIFRCPLDENGWTNRENTGGRQHPYVRKIRIPFEKNTDDSTGGSLAKNHLNELFGMASENFVGSIKDSFVGTGKQKAQAKAKVDAIKSLGKLAKSAITKDEEGIESSKKGLNTSTQDLLDATYNYGARYTKIADDAEKRAWKN